MRHLAGKRALITGAASGIGRAIALRLAAERMNLFLLDVDEVGLQRIAAELSPIGVEVAVRRCDVAHHAEIDDAVAEALQRWAGVDLLVNNAGVTYYGYTHEMADEHWDRLLAINLEAPLRLTRRLLPSLLVRPEAHVLNVCSVLGLVGMPRVGAYCTAKFGLVGFSESLRAEYRRKGLGVTALCPGFVRTNLFTAADNRPGVKNRTPPRSLCTTPEKVAHAAVRAVKRNQAIVRLEPFSRLLYAAKHNVPTALDWALGWGWRRRVEKKRAWLASLSDDPTEALNIAVARTAGKPPESKAA